MSGLAVCDLACGAGYAACWLQAAGATVTGIDLSAPLLEIARAEIGDDSVALVCADVSNMPTIRSGTFDGAVCSLALMDVADLDGCLAETSRVLRPGGWLVFTITHPCFQCPESRWTGKRGGVVKREVRGYFREGHWRSDNAAGVRGQVGAYHRTLSAYLNSVIRMGFAIERILEPQPEDDVAARVPGYAEVPVVLAVRCAKR